MPYGPCFRRSRRHKKCFPTAHLLRTRIRSIRNLDSDEPRKTGANASVIPSATIRLAELARGSTTALLLIAENGTVLAQNKTAERAFGEADLKTLLGTSERAQELLATVRDHGNFVGECELSTQSGPVWFALRCTSTLDPETREFAMAISAEDLTERRSAERAKDEFISIVNHELRTPLTAIRGAISLLANGIVEDVPQKAELFDIAWENAQRLGRLVDDLLDVQRLRIGAVDLVIAAFEMATLAAETLELLAPRARDASVTLRLAEPAPPLVVRADPGRALQALSNLVSNAIKHAPPGSEVVVTVEDQADFVRVVVHDNGPGVPESFVAKLFSPFSQADCTDARAGSGAGLGLYIVRTLIEAHGGRVGYTPAPLGATFYFELPASPSWSIVDEDTATSGDILGEALGLATTNTPRNTSF